MLPSPDTRGLGLRSLILSRPLWVHLHCGPVTRSPSRGWLCRSASTDSFPPLLRPKLRGSDSYPGGLYPTEHASLCWTHYCPTTRPNRFLGIRRSVACRCRLLACCSLSACHLFARELVHARRGGPSLVPHRLPANARPAARAGVLTSLRNDSVLSGREDQQAQQFHSRHPIFRCTATDVKAGFSTGAKPSKT